MVAVVLVAALAGKDSRPDPSAVKDPAPTGLEAVYAQQLTWSDCGTERCTWVKVPIDYADPGGATLRLRVKVHPSGDKKSTRMLFINPGGPGGSGVDFLGSFVDSASHSLRQTYSIVGFDPRGVGQSTPVACLSDRRLDALLNIDPDPDTRQEIDAFRQSTVELGKACQTRSGALAAHVSTFEAAKDIDVLRAVLGQQKLDYYGASYGTQLGATYAQEFPDNVGRMVLDGAVDPTLDDEQASLGQAEGFQRALTAYIADCVRSAKCPLGRDATAAEAKLAQFMQGLDSKPMKAKNGRILTEAGAFYGIAVTLYDREYWSLLTRELSDAFAGDPSLMLNLFDAYTSRGPDGSYKDNSSEVIVAIRCLDSSRPPTVAEVEASIPRFEKVSPTFGRAMAWGALGCNGWPIKSTHPQGPVTAAGAAPILVVGTTRDPATPYEWARALAKQLDSGVLVTREGDGHTGFHVGNGCIDAIVDDYLTKDTVPKDGVTCKAP